MAKSVAEDRERNCNTLAELAQLGAEEAAQIPALSTEKLLQDATRRASHDHKEVSACLKVVECFRRESDLVDATKDLVLFIGAEGKKGFHARGARAVGHKTLLRVLADHFLVVLVPEPYTSQLCPCCLEKMSFVSTRSYRRKECKCCKRAPAAPGGKPRYFRCDRDYAAAVNFYHIVKFALMHGGRVPRKFSLRGQESAGEEVVYTAIN
jgi:hypothetical protein